MTHIPNSDSQIFRDAAKLAPEERANANFNEMNRTMANSKFGFATSYFLVDWLGLQILLPEAEQLLEDPNHL